MDFKSRLNPQQYQAVCHTEGPLLILAGAGSGKTRVLTHRMAYLVLEAGAAPESIVGVTFTNKAAAEMAERTEALMAQAGQPLDERRRPWLGTFHRTCARLLRMYGDEIGITARFTIYDDGDQRAALKRAIAARDIDVTTKFVGQVASYIDRCKNQGLTPDKAMEEAVGAEAEDMAAIYAGYQRSLRGADCLDFGDLLLATVELLEQSSRVRRILQRRWRYLMVDEFQDTNPVQSRLLELLVDPERRNLAVVGDDDQSIYGWRGATVRNILDFTKRYADARVIKLEQNYRSTQVILDASTAVIEKLGERTDKRLWTDQGGGPPIVGFTGAHEREEAAWVVRRLHRVMAEDGVPPHECAVFYRTNAQARMFEEQFRAAGLGYQLVGGTSFYDRAEVKDLLAYLKVALNPDDSVNLLRVVNKPPRGLGKKTLEKIENLIALELGPQTLYQAMSYARQHKLFTGRQDKGLESFLTLVASLQARLDAGDPTSRITEDLIESLDYLAYLRKSHANDAEERRDHVMDMLGAMLDFEEEHPGQGLEAFLERSALVRDANQPEDQADGISEGPPKRPITMMTVHASKGLEFDAVFVVGLEDGLFPLTRHETSEAEIDEERRLCYVALTRARRRLFVSNARRRRPLGAAEARDTRPSRFLADIPAELVRVAPESAERKLVWRDPTPAQNIEARLKGGASGFDYDQTLQTLSAELAAIQRRKKRKRQALRASQPEAFAPEPFAQDDFSQVIPDDDFYDTSVEVIEATPAPRLSKRATRSSSSTSDREGSLVGRIVTHASEGIGEVVAVSGHGPRARLTVLFAANGKEMQVVRRFLKLH